MRAAALAASVLATAILDPWSVAHAQPVQRPAPDLARARTLDQQGVRAFREGRYNDAIRYFDEAYRQGGPSTELWNMARCQLKLDEPEAAADALERYLAEPDLSSADRVEAKAQLDELRHRHSTLTVTSAPVAAQVVVDGRRIGHSPLSVDLPPGEHEVIVGRPGFAPWAQRVQARFGRAIIVDAQLRVDPKAPGHEEVDTSSPPVRVRRFTSNAEIAVLWGHLGSYWAPAHPAGLLSVGYVLVDSGRLLASAGVRGIVTDDTWSNTVGASSPTSCTLRPNEHATALGLFVDGALGYRASSRVRIDGDIGFGISDYFATEVGGDLFNPTCSLAHGVRPALHVGASVSYAFSSAVRGVLSPILFEIQPAFGGTRTTPIDASGPWLRFGGGVGVAIDL